MRWSSRLFVLLVLSATNDGCYDPTLENFTFGVCDCTCSALQTLPGTPIGAGADDGQKVGTNQGTTSTTRLTLGTSNGESTFVAFRYPALGIPPGAEIQDGAYLQFTSASSDSGAASFEIAAELSANATPVGSAPVLDARVLSTNKVTWNVTNAWGLDDVGPLQKSPDLANVLREVIKIPGWTINSALVIIIKGTGTRSVRAFESTPAKSATLSFKYVEPKLTLTMNACLPGNLKTSGGNKPADADIAAYCTATVAKTMGDLATACKYADSCACTHKDFGFGAARSCEGTCNAIDVAADCSNFDPKNGVTLATNVPGDTPVCTVHSPVTAAMFGRRSRCEVSGTATIQPSGEDAKTTAARGVIEFSGDPCPNQSCAVGMEHRFQFDNVTFSHILGSATLSDMALVGKSAQTAVLASDGSGAFGIGATSNTAGGSRDNGDTAEFNAANQDVVSVSVNWTPGAALGCSLSGAVAGTFDPEQKRCENAPNDLCTSDPSVCGSDASCTGADNGDGTFVCQCLAITSADANVSLAVTGKLVNQPPKAVPGPDQTVECNSTNTGTFVLNGLGSTDPDGDFAGFRWFRGTRAGALVGAQPKVRVSQALDSEIRYVFRVIDTYAQADEASTKAKVVDTTAPAIGCNAPPTMLPSQAPITFTATAADICDASVIPAITSFTCFKVSKTGIVSKVSSCVVRLQGNKITISNSGGIDDHIRWQVSAMDDSRNTGNATCEVLVVQKK